MLLTSDLCTHGATGMFLTLLFWFDVLGTMYDYKLMVGLLVGADVILGFLLLLWGTIF